MINIVRYNKRKRRENGGNYSEGKDIRILMKTLFSDNFFIQRLQSMAEHTGLLITITEYFE